MKAAVPITLALCLAHTAAAADLLPHHAIYQLALDRSPGGTVVSADGRMDYELSDACEAWATAQRLDMTIINNDGSTSHMVSDYVTWEQKDGKLLRFRLRQTSNQKVVADVEGEATRKPDGSGQIRYSAPEKKLVSLPLGTLFPMAQTVALLHDEAAGKKFLSSPLFDGTDENGAEDSFAVLGALDGGLAKSRWAPLQHVADGKVTISFFDHGNDNDEPSYNVSMRYWQNGVSDQVAMDFGDFVVKGNLIDLSPNGKRC